MRTDQKSSPNLSSDRLAIGLAFLAVLCGGQSLCRAQNPAGLQAPPQKSPLAIQTKVPLPIILPYFLWQGLPLVVGTINGQVIAERFVIDTGLNACTITQPVAMKRLLPPAKNIVGVTIMDTSAAAPETIIKSLRLNSLLLENVPMAQIDVNTLLSHTPRTDSPGCWLGSPFLSAFQVGIDFDKHLILLNAPKAPLPTDPGTTVVPITLRGGRIYVKVSVPGAHDFTALVDTGSPGTLIPVEVAAKLKIKPKAVYAVVRPINKTAKAGLGVIPKMRIGKAEAKDVSALFLAPDAPPEFDRTLGVLGMDFLSRFKITIDYAQQKMALSPPEPVSAAGSHETAESPASSP